MVIIGERFNRLTILRSSGGKYKDERVLCLCDCGVKKSFYSYHLKRGTTKSCGCYRRENNSLLMSLRRPDLKPFTKAGKWGNTVHSLSKTRFYRIWDTMKRRCEDKKRESYKNYGGRGIKCLWNSALEFKNDMYESYLKHVEKYGEKQTTIERNNNDGNYCKENCRWATWKEQAKNKRKPSK